jgi:CxxC-x17-CxxC domain-containing protein
MRTDATLTCHDCGSAFTFSRGEQRFYATHGFDKPPSRCAECRAARKLEHGRTSGRDNAANRGPRQMFQATCMMCGRGALVPFQPRDDTSVSCTRCYARQRKPG